MPRVSETYPDRGDFMKADDLDKALTVTIIAVGIDDTFDRDDILLTFDETAKKLRLNKTNAEYIAEALGDEASNWHGAKLTLVSAPVRFQGRKTKGIRVVNIEPFRKAAPAAPATSQPEEVKPV